MKNEVKQRSFSLSPSLPFTTMYDVNYQLRHNELLIEYFKHSKRKIIMLPLNPMIINFHDACIYQSDLDLLTCGDSWLNDNILLYEMTHLSMRFKSSVRNIGPLRKIHYHFLDPSVVEFFMHSLSPNDKDDVKEIKNLYNQWCEEETHKCDQILILVPLNDNNSRAFEYKNKTGALGNHWSLLSVFLKGSVVASFHFDSSSEYNRNTAELVYKRMLDIIQIGRGGINSVKSQSLAYCNVPQQRNGYDCGIHTIITAESLSTPLAINIISKTDFTCMKECLETIVKDYMGKYGNTCEMGNMKRRQILNKIRLHKREKE